MDQLFKPYIVISKQRMENNSHSSNLEELLNEEDSGLNLA